MLKLENMTLVDKTDFAFYFIGTFETLRLDQLVTKAGVENSINSKKKKRQSFKEGKLAGIQFSRKPYLGFVKCKQTTDLYISFPRGIKLHEFTYI